MKKIFIIFFFFFLFPRKTFAKEATFLIINQIRGEEKCCEGGSLELIQRLREKKDIYNLSFSWALRFDALEDDRYIDPLKDFGEVGLLLEVTPNLASKSGVLYKGKIDGSDWYFAKNAFLVGYTQAERKKIIDTLFESFRKKFGYYPSFTVSWIIDAWSLNYIHNNYQVKLHELTKEQYETDSYTLYGGVFNAPYYPSKNHPLIPGQGLNKLDTVIVRQTISDLLYNYGSQKAYYTSQPNDYLENPKRADISYFQSLVEDTMNQSLEFQFGVLGFENSYSWEKYGGEYLKQLEFILEEQERERLKTILPSEYVVFFREKYKENPSFYFVKDFSPEKELGVLWYFGKTYRARIIFKERRVVLDDLRIYTSVNDPYKDKPAEADYSYWIVPYLIDGSQQYSLRTPKWWLKRLNHPSEGSSKALGPPGGPLTSDTLTSPFGIILGEGLFSLKTDNSNVEIEFTGDRKGVVRFLPEEILIDKGLNSSFSEPYQFSINGFFNDQKEVNLQFNKQFDFTIKKDLKTHRECADALSRCEGISKDLIQAVSINLGWKRDDKFISLLTIQKENSQFVLSPQTEQENLHSLDPMLQPDLSGLTVDSQKSVFYWNNKEAIAGRNPVRLFILPQNKLGRPTRISNVEVEAKTDYKLGIIYPDDYSYRVTPWFIDITSDVPLGTNVEIVIDGQKLVKDIPIEFTCDCQKELKNCLRNPRQLVKYILVLFNEQKMKLFQTVRNLKK